MGGIPFSLDTFLLPPSLNSFFLFSYHKFGSFHVFEGECIWVSRLPPKRSGQEIWGVSLGFWCMGQVHVAARPGRFHIFSLLLFFRSAFDLLWQHDNFWTFFYSIINPCPSLPGSSFSFPTWHARGTRFALHQEISHGLLAFFFLLLFSNLLLTSEHMMSVFSAEHKRSGNFYLFLCKYAI